jgi:hypothetical protein
MANIHSNKAKEPAFHSTDKTAFCRENELLLLHVFLTR